MANSKKEPSNQAGAKVTSGEDAQAPQGPPPIDGAPSESALDETQKVHPDGLKDSQEKDASGTKAPAAHKKIVIRSFDDPKETDGADGEEDALESESESSADEIIDVNGGDQSVITEDEYLDGLANDAEQPEDEEAEKEEESIMPANPEDKSHKAPEGPLFLKHAADPSLIGQTKPAPDVSAEADHKTSEPVANIDDVVDDIVARESDEVLAAEDAKRMSDNFAPNKKERKRRLRRLAAAWWHSKLARAITLAILVGGLVAAALVPASRYAVLNAAGVRVSASVRVLDETTQQPLKSARVVVGATTGKTDDDGKVEIANLKLGKQDFVVQKRAFSTVQRKVTLGWGSNPLGDVALKAAGVQYKFVVKDWLSGKPIVKAEASYGENAAISNDKGEITLVLESSDVENSKLELSFTADDYRKESLALPQDNKAQQTVTMVAGYPQVFVSKRSGKYDIYKIDADGKNEKLLLAGTGKERNDISMAVSEKSKIAALVSTREGQANKDGYLLQTLSLIDVATGTLTKVAASEQLILVGFADNRLLYVKIVEGASGTNPKRQRLMSYNIDDKTDKELASSNYFNDELLINGKVYYAPSNAFQEDKNVGLFRSDPVGLKVEKLVDKEVWNLIRVDYDHINYNLQQKWYSLNLKDGKTAELPSPPTVMRSRNYNESPDGLRVVWSEERDGKGVLLSYDKQSGKDTELLRKSGLKTPMRWLSGKHIIYRVKNEQETADYVLNIEGGDPKKISDVTDTTSVDRWYYY